MVERSERGTGRRDISSWRTLPDQLTIQEQLLSGDTFIDSLANPHDDSLVVVLFVFIVFSEKLFYFFHKYPLKKLLSLYIYIYTVYKLLLFSLVSNLVFFSMNKIKEENTMKYIETKQNNIKCFKIIWIINK